MSKITYFNENKTEQKQKGFIIANQYGGPIDVASWVMYKENLRTLPNIYEGKYVYVYEDNEIYFYNGTSWTRWSNNFKRVGAKSDTPDFKICFYDFPSQQPIEEILETVGYTAPKTIEARVYMKPGGFNDWLQFNNLPSHPGIPSDEHVYDYPKNLRFRWFLNNRENEVVDPLAFENNKSRVKTELVYSLSTEKYEIGHLICIAYYDGKPIAGAKLPFKNSLKDAIDAKTGMLFLTSKTPQLQRGYIMSAEQGGSIDATSSVNAKEDLASFDNNYFGKVVYSYSPLTDNTVSDGDLSHDTSTYDDGYLYYANNGGSVYPLTDVSQEDKIREVMDLASGGGKYVTMSSVNIMNDVDVTWSITGQNYRTDSSVFNGIYGKIAGITREDGAVDDNLGSRDIPSRRKNGYAAYYEAHLYLTVNETKTEVPVADAYSELGQDYIGKVFYEWTIYKPTGDEYYDPTDYDSSQNPVQDPDENRDVWVKNLDYFVEDGGIDIAGDAASNVTEIYNDTVGDVSVFDFLSDTYMPGVQKVTGQRLECLFTNDFDDEDTVELECTAYFKDENGVIKSVTSPRYTFNIKNEHLVYVKPDGPESFSGIKEMSPDQGRFVIDGGPIATAEDFQLEDNAYEVGYRIIHYRNADDAETMQNETTMFLHSTDSTENVDTFSMSEVVPSSENRGPFTFTFTMNGDSSKIPFGWYRVEVFRGSFADSRIHSDLRLYMSEPFHYHQTVTNVSAYVLPDNVWMGYYDERGRDISTNHEYLVTIKVEGTNLLSKDLPVVDSLGEITKKYNTSVLHSATNNIWTPCVSNDDYTVLSATQAFTDPRTNTTSKDRVIKVGMFSSDSRSEVDDTDSSYHFTVLSETVSVYNVVLPDLDLVVDSVYKRPDGSDIFMWNTSGYTIVNPEPYGIPYNGCTNTTRWVSPLPDGVVDRWSWTYNGSEIAQSQQPKLDFKGLATLRDSSGNFIYGQNLDGFEAIAHVNNPRPSEAENDTILDTSAKHLTGRLFSPEVYNIAVSIEQPHINTDSDYYETYTDYPLIAHVWWTTSDPMTRSAYQDAETISWHRYLSDSSAWTEFTDEELGGNTQFRWREPEGRDIKYSNTTPSDQTSRENEVIGVLSDGYRDVSLWFTSNTMVYAYTRLDVSMFGGYNVSTTEEIKVRNPIDLLETSYKIYYIQSSAKIDKDYGKHSVRQLEDEWIELTVTPTLVEWFTWQDIGNTLVFTIDNEVVDENSDKYTIEYEGERNHYYEGTFKVYWKRTSDIPDETHDFRISLNKCVTIQQVPIELVEASSVHLYPYGYDSFSAGFPADDNVFINAKVGTSQRYVLEIEGVNLDVDPKFLYLKKRGFSETEDNSHSIPSDAAETTADSTIFKKISTSSTKIVYHIDESCVENTEYTVTFADAKKTTNVTGRTYVFDDESIKGFCTTSAYYTDSEQPKSSFVFLDSSWINIECSFDTSKKYIPATRTNTVVEYSDKYTSTVEFDLHDIGILSGNNILTKSRDDFRSVYSLSIDKDLDTYTAVIENHDVDESDTLPVSTLVTYSWTHDGPSIPVAPTDTMDLNYLELYNDLDEDVTENVDLSVTLFYHASEFTNYNDLTRTIPDFVIQASETYTVPKLLYQMTVTRKSTNMTIGYSHPMSDLIDNIVCIMYRRDLDHQIERVTYAGSQLDDVANKKIVYTVVNSINKPATIASKHATVSTDNGCDILVEWKRTEDDTKDSTTLSWTSDIIKSAFSISPKTDIWDLKVDPVINTTVIMTGQNLMYAYEHEIDTFLTVEEDGMSEHNGIFNPGIQSNERGTYTYDSTWTDEGHAFVGDAEERTYIYRFGTFSDTYTAIYMNRKIMDVSFDSPCLVANQEYDSIEVPFTILSENMFGPDVDIKVNDFDLTWTSTPAGSDIEGTFTSAAGNTGEGILTLTQTSLPDDTQVSITVTRENVTDTFTDTIGVTKVFSITNIALSNGKMAITVSGQHMKCNTLHAAFMNDDYSEILDDISSGIPTNDTQYTWSNISYDNVTYYGGIDRYVKVWVGDGDKTDQYATYKIDATDAIDLDLRASDVSGSSVACTATSGTVSWKGTAYTVYADGSEHLITKDVPYSKTVAISTNTCTSSARNNDVTVTWTYAWGTLTKDKSISARIYQSGDTLTGTTYTYSNLRQAASTVACTATSVNATVSRTTVYSWASCGGTTSSAPQDITDTATFANNMYNTSAVTRNITFATSGIPSTITLQADSYSTSSSTSYTSASANDVNCNDTSNTIYVSGTTTTTQRWNSDNSVRYSSSTGASDSCTTTFPSICNQSSNQSRSGSCQGKTAYFTQRGDSCGSCTPTPGKIYANDSTLGGQRTLTVPGGSCSKYWNTGGGYCGTNYGSDTVCTVNPTCSNRTFICGGQQYTFSEPSGYESYLVYMQVSSTYTGYSNSQYQYQFSVYPTGPVLGVRCGNTYDTGDSLSSGSVSVSINNGGYLSRDFTDGSWTQSYSNAAPMTASISFNGGTGTSRYGVPVTLKCVSGDVCSDDSTATPITPTPTESVSDYIRLTSGGLAEIINPPLSKAIHLYGYKGACNSQYETPSVAEVDVPVGSTNGYNGYGGWCSIDFNRSYFL